MKRWILYLLAVALLLSGCGGKKTLGEPAPEQTTEPVVTEPATEETKLICAGIPPWKNAAVTDFGLDLLREAMEEDRNALISPVSIYAALAMTTNGAESETLTQMETVMGQSKDALNDWYKENIAKDDTCLHLANAVFIKDDPAITVKESFVKTVEKYYETDIIMDSFNESTLQGINRYVEDNTDGMIKDILHEIPEDAVMYLVNALAFEARWAIPYQTYQVNESTFTTEDGRKQPVELMYSEDRDVYVEDDLYTGFLKDYEGGRYVFVALLPREGVTVAEVVDSLSGDTLSDEVNSRWGGTVQTAMLKFQTEFDTEMNEVLKTMGVVNAFNEDLADFSGLGTSADGNIHLSCVLHKAFISVGEQGTRAGAATIVEAADGCAAVPEEIKEVILNRPFIYMIWDTEACHPVFMGTFMDAQAEGTTVPEDMPDICGYPAEDHCIEG